jgi:hypothetical protein
VENLCHVFQNLKDDNFNVNFEKCEYGKLKINFPCKTKPFKTSSKLKVEMWEPFSIQRHQGFVSFLLAHSVHYFLFFSKLVMPLNNILQNVWGLNDTMNTCDLNLMCWKNHSTIWGGMAEIPLVFKVIYFTPNLWMRLLLLSTIFIDKYDKIWSLINTQYYL